MRFNPNGTFHLLLHHLPFTLPYLLPYLLHFTFYLTLPYATPLPSLLMTSCSLFGVPLTILAASVWNVSEGLPYQRHVLLECLLKDATLAFKRCNVGDANRSHKVRRRCGVGNRHISKLSWSIFWPSNVYGEPVVSRLDPGLSSSAQGTSTRDYVMHYVVGWT